MKPYKLQFVQALKPEDLAVQYEFCREILARIENNNLPQGSVLVMKRLSTSTVKSSGIISMFGEQKILMSPSHTKEVYQK
jgi:hypothetical protein